MSLRFQKATFNNLLCKLRWSYLEFVETEKYATMVAEPLIV